MPASNSSAFNSSAPADAGWCLQHSYAQLPRLFHASVAPTPVSAPRHVIVNRPLAAELGLAADALETPEAAEWFAGNPPPPGASPLAQAYSGHQYGHFTTLGDGRAILLGEQITPEGARRDIQLKGAGRTPFSRGGDGRAALGPMLREYVVSEAMHALGIATTRSLAVVATGEAVLRQDGALPGAVLVRVAASHIRVGTFEWAADQGDLQALGALVDYTADRHYPETAGADNRALALLRAVVERQAALIARWMLVGFVHGVMNTDNMALSGETIDYGPCAFMDAYDPASVFSSIDRRGRYAYGNQPAIAQWNLARLAEALLPCLHPEEQPAIERAQAALSAFPERYRHHWLAGMRGKLGLFTREEADAVLCEELLAWMQVAKADYTNTFAALAQGRADEVASAGDAGFAAWRAGWGARLARQPQSPAEVAQLQRAHCPAVIPRNHQVEAALAAAQQGELGVMTRLLDVLSQPFEHERPIDAAYRAPAPIGGETYRTFCGT